MQVSALLTLSSPKPNSLEAFAWGPIMTNNSEADYRDAFGEYLRRGTPIRLGAKQFQPNKYYVGRTKRDDNVRKSHRENDGRLFNWASPPDTGHPGVEFGCRCQAVPYSSGSTEFAFHDMQDFSSVQTHRYGDLDFVAHYYYGDGRELTLNEIGHLREIAEHYAYSAGYHGAFRRLADQIADQARKAEHGSFTYAFAASYDFGVVAFSHGDGVVRGVFSGSVTHEGQILKINGNTEFTFSDRFEDPINLRIELGGKPYAITGAWTASFHAEVFADRNNSGYTQP